MDRATQGVNQAAFFKQLKTDGCVSCHRKKTDYGAGGFCFTCLARITRRRRSAAFQWRGLERYAYGSRSVNFYR